MPEMKGLLLKGYTQREFFQYTQREVSKKMEAWRPRGVVLHNTDLPSLAMWLEDPKRKPPLQPPQRIRNMSVYWVKNGFRGGPHLMIAPDKIWTVWPLWIAGTHSPSWNTSHWGIEMVGNFDKEEFPPDLRSNVVLAAACLYAMLGLDCNASNFKFHKEDPKTTHKNCPGKKVGTKASWIKSICHRMTSLYPGEHTP